MKCTKCGTEARCGWLHRHTHECVPTDHSVEACRDILADLLTAERAKREEAERLRDTRNKTWA